MVVYEKELVPVEALAVEASVASVYIMESCYTFQPTWALHCAIDKSDTDRFYSCEVHAYARSTARPGYKTV